MQKSDSSQITKLGVENAQYISKNQKLIEKLNEENTSRKTEIENLSSKEQLDIHKINSADESTNSDIKSI